MEEWVLAVGDIIVGMDIGTSKVSLVIGEVNSFNQVETLYTGTQKCSGIKKGKIISEEEIMLSISKLVKDAETELNFGINSAYVTIPGKYVTILLLKMQKINMRVSPQKMYHLLSCKLKI